MTTEKATAEQLPVIAEPRLPYHPAVEDRFGVDRASWRALVESTFPTASAVDSVILALSYCKARKLDVFKRVVHIVPIYDKKRKCMVDTVWPGIAEYRTTAFRTGLYVGKDATEVGETITETIGSKKITFPEWMRITVYRIGPASGERFAIPGPQVYWKETFSSVKDGSPNSMWAKRPVGMLEKCAEAAALRCAFPEELGGEPIAEEIDGSWHGRPAVDVRSTPVSDGLTPKSAALPEPEPPETEAEPPLPETLAEFPDQEPFVAEYMSELSECGDIIGVQKIQSHAEKNPSLDDNSKNTITTWCGERIAGIKATRGPASNT